MNRHSVLWLCLLMFLSSASLQAHDKIQDQQEPANEAETTAKPKSDRQEDPADVESPSDLLFPVPTAPKTPKVRVELKSGKEFHGELVEPTQFRVYTGGGAHATWARDQLERMVVLDDAHLVQVRLRDGRQIAGQLMTPYITLRKEYGQLSFARSRLKIVEDEVAVKVRQVLRPELPEPPGQAEPVPQPFVREAFVPAAPILIPDVFTKYPGVPTWHATPMDLNQLKSHYPRNFYGRP